MLIAQVLLMEQMQIPALITQYQGDSTQYHVRNPGQTAISYSGPAYNYEIFDKSALVRAPSLHRVHNRATG